MGQIVRKRTVVVVGGGVIGLNCARFLRARGHDVTVLERDRIGSGASRGNAGEIRPHAAMPLPAPGIVPHALLNLYRRDSAFYIYPHLNLDLVRFLWGFWRHSDRRSLAYGAAQLAALARPTMGLFDDYIDGGIVKDANDRAHLHVFGSTAIASRRRREIQRRLGSSAEVSELLDHVQLKAVEPCIGKGGRAGFLLERQRAIDPSSFVDNLAADLRHDSVEIIEGARVTAVVETRSGYEVRSAIQTIRADSIVIASGVWSQALCRSLGTRLPLFPGKGYSFCVPVELPPSRVLKLEDAHVAVVPIAGRVRVAGTMELDRIQDRFNPGRIEAIIAAARPYLSGARWEARDREWVGPRPMTTDGLPLIGALRKHPGVFVASGHNMLGLMLAPATAVAIADLMTDGKTYFDHHAFAPERH